MKIKAITIFLLCIILLIPNVQAEEITDITENTQIKYKWYTEEITEGLYYPKKDKLEGYLEDASKVEYGYTTVWDSKYCNYSHDNYIVETTENIIYERVDNTRYVKLENINYQDINNLAIYNQNQKIEFEILENEENSIKIDLKKSFLPENLLFYIDTTDKEYNVRTSNYEQFILESLFKTIKDEKILIPDKSWITENTLYTKIHTQLNTEKNDFIKSKRISISCRVTEKKTYRYKINKKYYDDNYYTYIENYLPDTNDYVIEYIGEFPTNTIEITNTETKIQKEYVYVNNNESISNYQSENQMSESTTNVKENINKQIDTKHIETEIIKEVFIIPKKIYLIISILVLIIVAEFIKIIIMKKRSTKTFI